METRFMKIRKAIEKARHEKYAAETKRIVTSGKCPKCGQGLRRNLAIQGWWQCEGYGTEGFRKDNSIECSFQCFTE